MKRPGLGIAIVVMLAAATVTANQEKNVWDGVFTAEQARRGKQEYEASCASCHMESAIAPALVGKAFLANWDKQTLRDLYSRLRTTMPADRPGTLSETTTLDLVAYLLEANGFPAGAEELKGGRDQLQAIRITSTR